MKHLVTDKPEDNIKTALNLFYIKDGWTWVRGGGPGPKYEDVSLCDFVRGMIKAHIPDVELPCDDEDLSFAMAEWAMDGPESIEGLIATVHEVGWAFAELRHRLKLYEDTGLEPEDLKNQQDIYNEILTRTYGPVHQKIADWLKAEQEGRLVVRTIKVGDHVWINGILGVGEAEEHIVSRVTWTEDLNSVRIYIHADLVGTDGAAWVSFFDDEIGRTVFLSMEEAVRALGKEAEENV